MLSGVRACLSFAVLALAIASECAAREPNEPMPQSGRPIGLRFDDEPIGGLPMGAYRVPDSEVIVSGRQNRDWETIPGTHMDASPLSLLIGEVVGTHHDAAAVEGLEAALHRHLGDELRRDVTAGLADPAVSERISVPGSGPFAGDIVEVSHAIILTFVDGPKAVPFVQVSALLRDANGHPLWRGTYSAQTGAERALDGDDGWLAHGGAAFDASVSASLAQAVKVLLADLAHPLARDPEKIAQVRTNLPYRTEAFYVVGYLLAEDECYWTITVQSRREQVTPGIAIVDKSLTDARPARDGLGVAVDVNTTPRGRALKAKFEAQMARQRASEEAQAARRTDPPAPAPAAASEPSASAPAGAPAATTVATPGS